MATAALVPGAPVVVVPAVRREASAAAEALAAAAAASAATASSMSDWMAAMAEAFRSSMVVLMALDW